MKTCCQNKKIDFHSPRIVDWDKTFSLSLLILMSGIFFLGQLRLVKESWAGNEKTMGASGATQENENCVVKGIFYDENNPRVLVNEELLSLNSYCCGGKIAGIFADFIVLEFSYGRREYKLGGVIQQEKIEVEPIREAPKTQPSYVNKVNSLVESFMSSHNQNNAALDMQMKQSLFADPNEAVEIRTRASRMLELIQGKKQELAGLSAPDNCKRYHSLTIKLFDLAEDGWRAVLAGNKDKAEVFFDRLLRISQEISRESVSILARQ
jgi:hypothetical protein